MDCKILFDCRKDGAGSHRLTCITSAASLFSAFRFGRASRARAGQRTFDLTPWPVPPESQHYCINGRTNRQPILTEVPKMNPREGNCVEPQSESNSTFHAAAGHGGHGATETSEGSGARTAYSPQGMTIHAAHAIRVPITVTLQLLTHRSP